MANQFRRGGARVLAGSVLGSLIFLAFTPVIARFFDPSSFGTYATILAVASSVAGASTLRLEILSHTVPDEMFTATLRAGLLAATAFSVFLSFIVFIVWRAGDLDTQWFWVGPLVLLTALQFLGSANQVRARRYTTLGLMNFVQNALLGPMQAFLGSLSRTYSSLVAGYAVSKLVWLPSLIGRRGGGPSAMAAWRGVRRASLEAGGSAGINSLATQSPVLLASMLYGSISAGLLAMAIRLIASPVGLVAAAASGAAVGEIGALLRTGRNLEAKHLVKRGMRDLIVLGLFPAAAVSLAAPFIVPTLLGENWEAVGVIISAMTFGILADFATSPFSQLCNIAGRHRSLLVWDTARLLVFVGAFSVPFALGLGIVGAVVAWSVAQVIMSGAMARIVVSAASSGLPRLRTGPLES